MFVLRKIDKESKREANINLGDIYTHVHSGNAKESFLGCLKLIDWVPEVIKETEIYAVITDENGRMHPLSVICDNYIMTESGKTFAKV